MTHAALVNRAVAWLRGTKRCHVVLTERYGRTGEAPDAIGWTPSGFSLMVECKVSRADFLADAKKPWRRVPEIAMGAERWYLTAPGLVGLDDLPEGWGLAEADARLVRVRRKAEPRRVRCYTTEIALLVSELRRYQLHGITYPPLSNGPRRTASQDADPPRNLMDGIERSHPEDAPSTGVLL